LSETYIMAAPYDRVVEVQLKRTYFQSLFEWPDAMRIRGSVIPAILPSTTLMIVFTALIAFLFIVLGWEFLSLPNSVVPSLSVVLGLLLAFRTNTAYDRFWEGRKLFQTVTSTVRNLCRTIWLTVPEESQSAHDEKMACIKLLVAFVVATKHHLREEFGTDYYDLDTLLPKNWIPAAAAPEIRVVTNPTSPPPPFGPGWSGSGRPRCSVL
jgi:putative membrane protein